jgi:hypothetical protein
MTEFFCAFPQVLKNARFAPLTNHVPKYHAMKVYMGCRSKAPRITDMQVNSQRALTHLYGEKMLSVAVVSEAVWNPSDHWILDVHNIKS